MKTEYSNIPLYNNEAAQRYELQVEGETSIVAYKRTDTHIYLLHTEVPQQQEGRGIATAIIEKTLLEIEAKGLRVRPLCPAVVSFLKRHPEWNRLVDEKMEEE